MTARMLPKPFVAGGQNTANVATQTLIDEEFALFIQVVADRRSQGGLPGVEEEDARADGSVAGRT